MQLWRIKINLIHDGYKNLKFTSIFFGDDFPKIEAPKIDIHNITNGELFYQYNVVKLKEDFKRTL